MTTLEIPADLDLRDLVSSPGRTLSVYFRRPRTDESTAARRHAVVARLAEQGVGAALLRAVDDVLCDVRPGRGAVALFAPEPGHDGNHHRQEHLPDLTLVDMPGAAMPDHVAHAALPELLPLLAWRQATPAYVRAVLDRTGADIEAHPAGGGEPHVTHVEGLADEFAGPASGEADRDHLRHRAEEAWRQHAAHTREAVAEALLEHRARILLLGGDARSVQLFTEALPSWVRHEIDLRRIAGGRGPDGSRRHRAEHVATALAEAVGAGTRTLLDELADHRGPGGLAVQGAPAVLHALARGRVRTLLVTDSGSDERVAWFGEKAGEVSGHRSELERSGAVVRRGRLVDAAVRSAILTGADVRVLRPGTAGAPEQGLGALCRFQ